MKIGCAEPVQPRKRSLDQLRFCICGCNQAYEYIQDTEDTAISDIQDGMVRYSWLHCDDLRGLEDSDTEMNHLEHFHSVDINLLELWIIGGMSSLGDGNFSPFFVGRDLYSQLLHKIRQRGSSPECLCLAEL